MSAVADKICNATKSFLSSFFFSIPWTGEPGACCLLVFSSDHTALLSTGLWRLEEILMCWEIRLIYQLQLHFLTRQESLTHKVEEGTILFGLWAGSVLRCFMEYCGFITSCGGFNPCNNYHNSESLWWISSTYSDSSDSSDSLEKCIQYFRRNLFSNKLYGQSKVLYF